MHRVINVALREFTETVRTKLFIFSVLLTPAIIIFVIFLTRYMDDYRPSDTEAKRVAVVDRSGKLETPLNQMLAVYKASDPELHVEFDFIEAEPVEVEDRIDALQEDVRNDVYAGCMEIAENVTDAEAQSYYYTKARKIEDMRVSSTVENLMQQAVNALRFSENDVSPALVARLTQPIDVTTMDISGETKEATGGAQAARLITPFAFVGMLFMSILATNQGMLTSVIEEKNTRIVEVLLSALRPWELMTGKIIGLVAVGTTVMAMWTVVGYGAAMNQGYGEYINLAGIHYFIIYYFLGFVLYSSIYAAIGASCNSIQETQSLMTPIMLLIFSPMFFMRLIVTDPGGLIPTLFSFIPFTSPMVMPLRYATDPDIPAWQIWASIVVLAVSVPLAMWIAARIFRIGILMYGKPASLWELARWVRRSG